MGVYIPNMKMPEHCGVCRFAVDGWCYAYGKPNIDALANDGRTNFCPLVPVPPHGDLIDRDALKDVQQADADFFKGSSDHGEKCRYDEAINAVANIVNAPTIIPAEPFNNLSKPCKDDADFPICTKASPASLGIYKKAEEGE